MKPYKPSKELTIKHNEFVIRYGEFKNLKKKIYEYMTANGIVYMDELGVIYNHDPKTP